jgi:hypothetical protein
MLDAPWEAEAFAERIARVVAPIDDERLALLEKVLTTAEAEAIRTLRASAGATKTKNGTGEAS